MKNHVFDLINSPVEDDCDMRDGKLRSTNVVEAEYYGVRLIILLKKY